jgi:5-methylcytosine-specific restriction endonuclease McrA
VCRACKRKRRRPAAKAAKLRRRGAAVETIDPVKVLIRDRWTCQLCGAATPKRLRGSYDDRAPEVDHIVPIAAGGEHSYANTQCACRRCNLDKSDKPLGQMRLFG